jgi:hypothetical protein
MSSSRIEYVMVGAFVEKLPFDEYDEKYEPHFWKPEAESLHIVRLCDCDGATFGFVVGRILVRSVSECACSDLSEIHVRDNMDNIVNEIDLEIQNKLGFSTYITEIKYYTFTVWG